MGRALWHDARVEVLWRTCAILALVFGIPPAFVLTFAAETGRGTTMGITGVLLALALVILLYGKKRSAAVPAGLALVIVIGLAATIPPNGPSAGFDGDPIEAGFWQILPEVDQIKLGLTLVPVLDPFIDVEQAKRIANVTLPIYREMPDHPRTALAYGYAELFGGAPDDGHMYWSRPEKDGAPVLVFLHGSAGNFASYPRVFQGLEIVVVCPTLGFGMYMNEERTRAAVDRARRFAVQELGGDPDRMFLAGLSQGGVGATQVGATASWAKGVVLISPVLDAWSLGRWKGPELLVLHGDLDRRIPKKYVVERLAAVKTATVTARYFEDEDHFLLYSKREAMIAAMRGWIESR